MLLHRLTSDEGRLLIIFVPFLISFEKFMVVFELRQKAMRMMQVTTVMVVILIAWCIYTVWLRHPALPPIPHPKNLKLEPNAMGWLYGLHFAHLAGILAIFIGLGHSVLAMSGEESLAQVYREIEHPKLPNLKKTGLVI